MRTRSSLALLVAVLFLLSLSSVVGYAWGSGKMTVKGTITNIENNKVTVKDAKGNEKTVEVKDIKDTKAGDKVEIKNGVIKKVSGKHKKTEKSEMPPKSGLIA